MHRLALAFVLAFSLCSPAVAQHVICCSLLIDVKGDWIGASRECAARLAMAPPDVLKKACEELANCEAAAEVCPAACDQAKIDALRGRMRGLNEAIRAHEKSFKDAQDKRAEARDKLWGKGEGLRFEAGSIADFGKAALDTTLIATGGGGRAGQAYSKAMKGYKEMREWVDRGVNVGTDPASVEAWGDLGQEFLKMQAGDVLRTRGTRAARAAREHFAAHGNNAAAGRVWSDTMRGYGRLADFKGAADKVGKFTGVVSTLANFYDKTSTVFGDGQSWGDAYRDQKIAEKAIAKAEAEREALQKQLSRLLEACGIKPGEGLPPSGPGSRAGVASAAAPVFLEGPPAAAAPAAPAALTVASPQAMGEARYKAMQAALKEVRVLGQQLRDMDRRLGAQIVTPLGPWFADVRRELPPQVLLAVVTQSRASMDGFEATLGELEQATARAWRALEAISPDDGS